MSSRWFYAKDGKAHGPLSLEQVQSMIASSELSGASHIFREGETQWKKLAEFVEFKTQLQSNDQRNTTPASVVEPGKWIVLAKSVEDTKVGNQAYNQKGPYTREQILQLIQDGDIRWTDHVWTQGMTAWARISTVKEFNDSIDFKKDPEVTATPSVSTPVASAVTTTTATSAPAAVSTPPVSVEPVSVVANEKTHVKGPSIEDASTATGIVLTEKFWNQKRFIMYGGTFAAIGLVVILSVMFSTKPSESDREPQSVEPVAAITAPPPPPSPPPQPVAPPAPAPDPAFVKIIPMKLDSPNPQLAFETNIPVGEALTITVTAKKGQILELAKFEKTTQIARQSDVVPTLDMTKWNLPSGAYVVNAESKEANSRQEIFIGLKNRQFQTKLDAHNKRVKMQAQAERRELLAFSKRVQVLASRLEKAYVKNRNNPKAWQKFYKPWVNELSVAPKGLVSKYKSSNANRYVNSRTIADAKDLIDDMKDVGKSLDTAIKSKRAPASVQEIAAIKTRISKLDKTIK